MLTYQVWSHEGSTFWKNMARNGQYSRPAESDLYVSAGFLLHPITQIELCVKITFFQLRKLVARPASNPKIESLPDFPFWAQPCMRATQFFTNSSGGQVRCHTRLVHSVAKIKNFLEILRFFVVWLHTKEHHKYMIFGNFNLACVDFSMFG